jgi:hypothetical protein
MIPVEVEFDDDAHADTFIAVLKAAGATDIVKNPKNAAGKIIVTFNEPTDDP